MNIFGYQVSISLSLLPGKYISGKYISGKYTSGKYIIIISFVCVNYIYFWCVCVDLLIYNMIT